MRSCVLFLILSLSGLHYRLSESLGSTRSALSPTRGLSVPNSIMKFVAKSENEPTSWFLFRNLSTVSHVFLQLSFSEKNTKIIIETLLDKGLFYRVTVIHKFLPRLKLWFLSKERAYGVESSVPIYQGLLLAEGLHHPPVFNLNPHKTPFLMFRRQNWGSERLRRLSS